MRRIAPAAILTTAAVGVVALFDPALAGVGSSDEPVASGATAAKATPKASAPKTSAPKTSSPQPSTPEATQQADTKCSGDEVTGPKITTRWGPVQVAGTVKDGKLCEVHAVAWPDGDNRSYQISQYSIPRLDAMATEDGVEFNGISGATYTSEGYRSSLQGLIDSL